MIYLDSSVALAHLLAEDRFPPDLLWDQQRYQLQNSHGDAVRSLIGRVAMIEMVGPVLARALQPFPAPKGRPRPPAFVGVFALYISRKGDAHDVEIVDYHKG